MHPAPLRLLKNPLTLLLALLIITGLVYFRGLNGDFVFDDRYNLMMGDALQVKQLNFDSLRAAAFSSEAGPLMRPVSMLSFALNYHFTGSFDPFYFKLVNLVIHLLCGASLYLFLTLLFAALEQNLGGANWAVKRHYLAFTITAAWLLHPLALTSVLYVVQRMNSLSALFTLWGLILYLLGRRHVQAGRETQGLIVMVAGILGCGALATLSKENGVLLPFYALAVETTIFQFRTPTPSGKRKLYGLFFAVALLPILGAALFVTTHPDWLLHPYRIRDFTLPERLMTEPRILWHYLKWIVLPNNIDLGLFHDDIPLSTSLLHPVTTLLAILGLVLLLIAAWLMRKRAPLVTFGILWFLVGHSLESSFLALEIAHEHRNYLPMAGILTAVFYVLSLIGRRPKLAKVSFVASILAVTLFAVTTASRAATWGNITVLDLTEVEHHPNSARLNYEAGRMYALSFDRDKTQRELYVRAKYYLVRTTALNERSTNGLIGFIFLTHMDGHSQDLATMNELQRRLRTSFISAFDLVSLDKLAGAQGETQPILPNNEISALFDAVLDNPTLNPVTRGMVFSIMSSYYANQRHDYHDATLVALKAIEVAPDEATFNINFSNLLVAMHQFDAAREQLRLAKSKDRLGTFAMVIAANEKKIDESQQRSGR